ncbi:hypothetical protein ACIPY6_44015 [Streptomyces sp. NPDC090054]|uniref:hypothetical protein n=1 Tax=Streptomyces sp. NPDC090054 TaxID=3365933 RepID=UPI0038039B9D
MSGIDRLRVPGPRGVQARGLRGREGGEMVLRPPVEPMLAQAAEEIPPARPLASKVAYEQKFDGHPMLVFTSDGARVGGCCCRPAAGP